MEKKNYDENEFQEAILKVMDRLRKKYNFGALDGDDVAQEAYIIALDVMAKYKSENGRIVNFLSVAVGNRIKNLMRDTLVKEIGACSLDNIQDEYDTIGNSSTTSDEFWEMIDENLHPSFRRDYLKLKQGIKIPKLRKQKIINAIRDIINESL